MRFSLIPCYESGFRFLRKGFWELIDEALLAEAIAFENQSVLLL